MSTFSDNNLIKYLSFFSFLLLLGGCASTMSQHDLSTCIKRGGKVENRCTVMSRDSMGRNTGCQMSQDVCVGGISHEAYEKQQKLKKEREQRSNSGPNSWSRLENWLKVLKAAASEDMLKKNSHKLPKLTWLFSRWCLKGSNSKLPANYFRLDQKKNGELQIVFSEIDNVYQPFSHVEINGDYYDLWSARRMTTSLNEHGRRLKKISEEEYTVVYIFKGPLLPMNFVKDKNKLKQFFQEEAQKVRPEQHIKTPKVFVKCE